MIVMSPTTDEVTMVQRPKTYLLDRHVGERVHDSVRVVGKNELRVALAFGLELGLGDELAEVNALAQRLEHSDISRRSRTELAMSHHASVSRINTTMAKCNSAMVLRTDVWSLTDSVILGSSLCR